MSKVNSSQVLVLFIFALLLCCACFFINDIVFAQDIISFENSNYCIQLTDDYITLKVLSASNANYQFNYIVDNQKVVQVDDEGNCYPIGIGTTKVTAIEKSTGMSCETYVSVAEICLNGGLIPYSVIVDQSKEYIIYATQNTTVREVVEKFNPNYNDVVLYNNISLGQSLDNIQGALKFDYKYKINVHIDAIDFELDKDYASIGEIVYLHINEVPNYVRNYRFKAINVNKEELTMNQIEHYFIMGGSDADVYINVKDQTFSCVAGDFLLENSEGFGVSAVFNVTNANIATANYPIPEDSQIIKYYKVDTNIHNDKNTIVKFKLPDELQSSKGIYVVMYENGLYVEKNITVYNNGYISFETNDLENFAIIAKKENKVRNLTGVIILLCFLNSLAAVGIIILSMKYIDNKQNPQRYKKRAYSSILTMLPFIILSAVKPTQIAGVVVLGFLLIVQIIILVMLIIKLTEQGALLTSSKDYKRIKY